MQAGRDGAATTATQTDVLGAVHAYGQANAVDLFDPVSRITLNRDNVYYVLPWRGVDERALAAAVLRSPEPATPADGGA